MLARFHLVGILTEINPPRQTLAGNTVSLITVDVDSEIFPIILQGKILGLLESGKLKVNDIVAIEGKLQKDKTFTNLSAKSAVIMYASFLNVVSV